MTSYCVSITEQTTAKSYLFVKYYIYDFLSFVRRQGATCIDRWPLIFKDMRAHGYVTYYSEDEVWNGAITARLHGFCKPPIDHYLLPLWYAGLNKMTSLYRKVVEKGTYIKGHCLGSQAIYNVSFNAVQSFFEAYPNTPKFGFQFNADFCHHENFNFISLVENKLLNFLKLMKDKNYLNNTLLILFGDFVMALYVPVLSVVWKKDCLFYL